MSGNKLFLKNIELSSENCFKTTVLGNVHLLTLQSVAGNITSHNAYNIILCR